MNASKERCQVDYRAAEDIDNGVQEGSGNLGAYVINRFPLFIGTGVHLTTL
jgi:hypothetical protein